MSSRDAEERSIISAADLRRTPVRIGLALAILTGLVLAAIVGLGPLLWLAKAAVSTTEDTVTRPLALWPSGVQWHNIADAWTSIGIGRSTLNTILLAAGTMITSIIVSTTGGYVLAVLRPRWAPVLQGLILATLFVPGTITLVPLYLTVKQLGFTGNYFGVWLPAAASAFNLLIVKQFFDRIPAELYEAARIDGAGSFGVFVWILLPMARPILGVVLMLTFIASWKDFLWPLLVLTKPETQPLSVALFKVSLTAEKSLLLAGMFCTVVIPLVLFLIFQRQFLRSAGAAGAVKG
ncbi:carbohydrate ABC transporter permease [Kribbella sp. NPDC059898]|uniref:carbohydrate ABC transporter permease n=1 Tax=Kribbella sp. NPDC059898 TaxID=3346995 RepID=UPI0036588962